MIGVVSQSMTRGCRGMEMLMMATVVSNIGPRRSVQDRPGGLNVQSIRVYRARASRSTSAAQEKTGCYGQCVESLDD
jgi:hypothetical protein